MKLREFAKKYINESELREDQLIIPFIDAWEAHLTDLKNQFIKDKASLHPEDLDQAKRHLMFDKTFTIMRCISNLMDVKPNPNFVKGGEINGAQPRIIIDNEEMIMPPLPIMSDSELKKMINKGESISEISDDARKSLKKVMEEIKQSANDK